MFSYYGSKSKIVDYYPSPKYKRIIEPFAGSARYSLKYWQNDVLLVDKYDVIVKIWKWLQKCSSTDIKKLPRLKEGDDLRLINFDCEEARMLMGFLVSRGIATPNNIAVKWVTTDRPNWINYRLTEIEKSLHKIKHWTIKLGTYDEIQNVDATWFIDPPYQFGGEHYKESSKNIDFAKLSEWCKSRNGQVIVCENTKADWLPFKPMVDMHGTMYKTTESIWSNLPTSYDYQQSSLF